MTLKDIIVISGHGGLFKYITKGHNKTIVENISDHKRTAISSTVKISMLEEIAVFTDHDDVPLREVFRKIQERENGGAAIPHKSADVELKRYFAEILPEYAKDRVYMSDIRKIIMWYNLLNELGITDFEAPEEEKGTREKEETGEAGEVSETSENQ